MLKIGFLTIGEGGSNIGEYAAGKGCPVIAVNSAKIDLGKLKAVPKDSRIHLAGWEGAGRNRDVGKEAMIAHAETISEKARVKHDECDIVFVVGSTGGGTGSGALPVGVEILSDFKKHVGAITILPALRESPKAHMNSLECFSEMSQFEDLGGVFTIDNEKAEEIFKGQDRTSIYELSNQQIIDNLVEVSALTGQSSYVSNFDKNDLLEVLSDRGCTVISKIIVPIDKLKNSLDIVNAIRDSWKQVCSPDIAYGQIVKAVVLGKIPKEMTSIIDVKKVFEETGMPYDIIEAYYPNTDHQNHCIFYTILSGLAFPVERLNQIEINVQKIEQDLMDRMESSRNQTFKTSNWNSKFKSNLGKEKERTTLSLAEKLAKYK
ncbi:MAG: hypothetical protein K0R18_175 [Bacillales bacterium]|jgi:cell division GTPase FtsZ|nr:hypothetical protein [Bacillales bacterium]